MDFQEADLPAQLVLNVSRLSTKRNRVVVLPTTQQSMSSGSGAVVNFQLPDRSICDLSTATLVGRFQLTCDTATSTASNIAMVYPDGSDLIAQNQLLINGGLVVSGSLDQYAYVSQKIFKKLQHGEQYRNSAVLSRENGQYINANIVANISGGTAFGEVIGNASTSSGYTWISYSEQPACRTSKMLDTSIYGKSYLTYRPSGITQIKATNLSSRNARWVYDQLELSLDILSEPPVEYVELVKSMIAMNRQFKQVFCNPVSSVFSYNNNIKLNVSSGCIDSFACVPIQNNGLTAYYSDNAELEAPCFKFSWGSSATFGDTINLNLRVGNMSIPQTGQYTYLWKLADCSKEDTFGDSIYNQSSLYVSGVQQASPFKEVYSEAGYTRQNAVYFQNLAGLLQPAWNHDRQILSGYNSMGQDVVFSLSTAPSANITTTNAQVFLLASTSAVAVMDSQSGSVSIIY